MSQLKLVSCGLGLWLNNCFLSVIDVSKKTGDYASLSFVDLKVIALTLDLHIEHCGRESVVFDVQPKPPIWEDVRELKRKNLEERNAANQEKRETAEKEMSEALERLDVNGSVPQNSDEKVESNQPTENTESPNIVNNDSTKDADEQEDSGNCEEQEDSAGDEEEEVSEGESEEEEQDQTGKKRSGFGEWIDESNIQEVVARMEAPAAMGEKKMEVACLTTDFALQNVLLHMKLSICSIDGIKVNRLRSYILRCRFVFASSKPS